LRGRLDAEFRAGIDTADYEFRTEDREPYTLLFLGSFRHVPNMEALLWFVNEVLPLIQEREPRVRLIVIGSDPPPRHSLPENASIKLIGFVEDVREPLSRYAAFVCPIKSGSGVRVKLLEAFAAGIAVVSTHLGAEGLATEDGNICALADDAPGFADRCLALIEDRAAASEMAVRARAFVEDRRDMRRMTERLHESYRETVRLSR
jgi:glycosyltransferase involved in cell wall biosynthesis